MTVERDINKRWEQGIPHHPEAEKIAEAIAEIDFKNGGDFFCFKFGGDGDNGEHLCYLLSIYFELLNVPPNGYETLLKAWALLDQLTEAVTNYDDCNSAAETRRAHAEMLEQARRADELLRHNNQR